MVTFKDLVQLFDELKKKYPVQEIMEMQIVIQDNQIKVIDNESEVEL